MESVEPVQILSTNIESSLETSAPTSVLSMALAALRISSPKVPHASSDICESDCSQANALAEISLEEVSNHDSPADCWIVIYDRVYDITKFLNSHPGGDNVIIEYGGRDATIAFRGSGHSEIALTQMKEYLIGELPLNERLFRRPNGGLRLSGIPD